MTLVRVPEEQDFAPRCPVQTRFCDPSCLLYNVPGLTDLGLKRSERLSSGSVAGFRDHSGEISGYVKGKNFLSSPVSSNF
jgi:hypothetical protein